jgi:SAM-dependent methyltransferase
MVDAVDKWPKKLPELSDEQKKIRDDFMNDHLHDMRKKWYGCVEKFNHGYPMRSFRRDIRTLEIGAGIGAHLEYEDISRQEYYANEYRPELCRQLMEKFPGVTVIQGDCQEKFHFENASFDRVLAIHVLEHLPNLPKAVAEIRRVIKDDGLFSVVIPCEGGFATMIARNISTRPRFEKKYPGQKYDWLIASEHINFPGEIIEEMSAHFTVSHRKFYPLLIPSVEMNLCIGFTLRP